MEEVLHELALDSGSEDEPASFDSSDSGRNVDSFVLVFISQIPLFFAVSEEIMFVYISIPPFQDGSYFVSMAT